MMANHCQWGSAKQGGYWVPDPDERHAGFGSGQYCMITSQGVTLCSHLSREFLHGRGFAPVWRMLL